MLQQNKLPCLSLKNILRLFDFFQVRQESTQVYHLKSGSLSHLKKLDYIESLFQRQTVGLILP